MLINETHREIDRTGKLLQEEFWQMEKRINELVELWQSARVE